MTATALAPSFGAIVGVDDKAGQHRAIWIEVLANDLKTKVIEPAELGQVRAPEGNVRQVEVFWMRRVGTFIFGMDAHPETLTSAAKALPCTDVARLVNSLLALGGTTAASVAQVRPQYRGRIRWLPALERRPNRALCSAPRADIAFLRRIARMESS